MSHHFGIISVFLALVLVEFYFFPQFCFAQKDFSTNVDTLYRIDEQGLTHVTKNFVLTNLTKDTYVTQYALKLSNFGLDNFSATNEDQNINPHVVTSDNSTTVSLNFQNTVVGEGRSRHFSISYTSAVFATLNASVLELNLPGYSNEAGDRQTIHVETLQKFASPYRALPEFDSVTQVGQYQRFSYDNPTAANIMLVFGEKQTYQAEMQYELTNNSRLTQRLTIPIPPDTPLQRVMYNRVEPKPEQIFTDADGNWLAVYDLPAKQTSIITANLQVELYLEPWLNNLMTLPLAQHLQRDGYWQLDENVVTQLLGDKTQPQEIYQTVLSTLDYTGENLTDTRERLGAAGAIQTPKNAVCQEYTDLFIALARSQGIPARRAIGYAYSNQQELKPSGFAGDVLHTWPEYFDTPTASWRAVDPTWEDTTGGIDYFNHFDLGHIVFVYNGVINDQPLPPGSYQQSLSKKKTITVNTINGIDFQPPQFEVQIAPIKFFRLDIPVYTIVLSNQTGQAWYNLVTQTSSPDQEVATKWLTTGYPTTLLPFSQHRQTLVLTKPGLRPKLAQVTLKLQIDPDYTYEKTFTALVLPEIIFQPIFYWLLGAGATGFALVGGSLLVLRQNRQRTLRRQSQEPAQAYQQLLKD